MRKTACILTVSDRSSQGIRADLSGPALKSQLEKNGFEVLAISIVPDETGVIEKQILEWVHAGKCSLILTTGGTGFAPRDITPEATRKVIERETPGISETIRRLSIEKTPHAMLSRAISGISQRSLIINLPGSPKAACESIDFILPVLNHALELIQDAPDAEQNH